VPACDARETLLASESAVANGRRLAFFATKNAGTATLRAPSVRNPRTRQWMSWSRPSRNSVFQGVAREARGCVTALLTNGRQFSVAWRLRQQRQPFVGGYPSAETLRLRSDARERIDRSAVLAR